MRYADPVIRTRCSPTRRLPWAALAALLLACGPAVAQAQGAAELARGTDPLGTPVEADVPEPPPANFALARPLHLGLGGFGGIAIVPEPSGTELVGWGWWGHALTVTVHDFVSLGVTRTGFGFGYSSIEGPVLTFDVTPMVELFDFVDPHVQLYTQLGATLQGRSETEVDEAAFQASGFLAVGARFWATEWFSIAVDVGANLTLTRDYFLAGHPLPRWSVPLSLGLALEWHIAP